MTFDAPQVLIICADPSEAWVNPFNGRSSAEMDASIVAAHMMLQMQELGIGSTMGLLVRYGEGKTGAGPAGKR